jgi:heme a synthase
VIGLLVLAVQIVLGGWVSTNYAALACTDLPTCQGKWWPSTNFAAAFHVFRELGKTSQGTNLDQSALTAIHLSHRIGAVVAAGYLLWLGAVASKVTELAWIGRVLMLLVVVQVLLGVSNVWFSLPLFVAVSHNGVAAVLVAALVMLNFRAFAARMRI